MPELLDDRIGVQGARTGPDGAMGPGIGLLSAAVERSAEAVLVLDASTRVVWLNPAAQRMFGAGCAPAIGATLREALCCCAPERGPVLDAASALCTAVRRGRAVDDLAHAAFRPDGTSYPVLCSSRPVRAGGRLAGSVVTIREAAAPDACALRRARLVAQTAVAVIEQDLHGTVTDWNEAAEHIFGWSAADIVGRPAALLVPPGLEGEYAEIMACVRRGEPSVPIETRRRTRAGAIVEIGMTISPLRGPDGTVAGAVQIAADIRVRKRAEHDRHERRRSIAMASDREKLRVARELHDHLGQDVTGLLLGLQTLEAGVTGPSARQTLRWLKALAGKVGEQLHRAAWELRPTSLDDVGLVSTLETHLGEWSRRTGVRADFHHSGTQPGGPATLSEIMAYRVIQEALENAGRHAAASRVSLLVECHPNLLRLILEDDGRGFDLARVDPSVERGLTVMRERAALVGGRVTIETAVGAGTTVFVTLPRLPDPGAPRGRDPAAGSDLSAGMD